MNITKYQKALDEISECEECESYLYDEGETGYSYKGHMYDTHSNALDLLQELIDFAKEEYETE